MELKDAYREHLYRLQVTHTYGSTVRNVGILNAGE